MKKILCAVTASVLATTAFAQTSGHGAGQLNVYGKVTQNTCQLAPSSANVQVELGSTPVDQLAKAGSVSARPAKPFTIELINCPASYVVVDGEQAGTKLTQAAVKFATSANVTEDGYLKNVSASAAKAENVQVRLLNADAGDEVINLRTNANAPSKNLADANGSITFNLKAQLGSKEGNATPGHFQSSVPFEIVYK